MNDNVNDIIILKSKDPNKLQILRASSTVNEIRFFLNQTHYVAAHHTPHGIEMRIGCNDSEEKEDKNSVKKIFLALLIITVITVSMVLLLLNMLAIHSMTSILAIISIMNLYLTTCFVCVIENQTVPKELKSKHSAEHMMYNYLEQNRRMPSSIYELKKSSRFSKECGSVYRMQKCAESFVKSLIGLIAILLASGIVQRLTNNQQIREFFVICVFFSMLIFTSIMIDKNSKFKKLVDLVSIQIGKLLQLGNTVPKNKVKKEDYELVFYVAREWMQIVYPELL